MPYVSLITNVDTGQVYSVVIQDKDRLRAIPVSSDSSPWAAWVDDSKATFADVKNCLDFGLQNELPQDLSTKAFCDIENRAGFAVAHNAFLLSGSESFLRVKQNHENFGDRFLSKTVVTQSGVDGSAYYRPLLSFDDPVAAGNFKAHRFITDTKYAAFKMQLKAVRAIFDRNVGPGGGWRCPEGTLNGGQITDRFGRGCGGLTRRLGRLLSDLMIGGRSDKPEIPKPDKPAAVARQRRASGGVRGAERSAARGRGRADRQTGRVFDRQQNMNETIVDGFERGAEYRRQRDENRAAQEARRRPARRGRRQNENNLLSSERILNEEAVRLAEQERTLGRTSPLRERGPERLRGIREPGARPRRIEDPRREQQARETEEYLDRLANRDRSVPLWEEKPEGLRGIREPGARPRRIEDPRREQQARETEEYLDQLATEGRTSPLRERGPEGLRGIREPGARPRRQRGRQISESISEQSNDLTEPKPKRNYFSNDSRKLSDPVKTSIIEGRSLQQLEDIMRESETNFSLGRDPSGDFEAAEQFSRAYNAIASEVRQAVRQLEAFDNGELFLSEEEVEGLESFVLKAKDVLDSELPGFPFAVDAETIVRLPYGRTVNLGLAHPMFTNEDRSAFIEGRADFIAELYEASNTPNVSLAERIRRTEKVLDRFADRRDVSISDNDSRDVIQEKLRQGGPRSFGSSDIRDFLDNEFGLSRQSLKNIVSNLDEIEEQLKLGSEFDANIRKNTGVGNIDYQIDNLSDFFRERHFALDRLFSSLLSENESPFAGRSGDDLLDALRSMNIPEMFNGVNENDLRSPNSWRSALEQMQRNEKNLYFDSDAALTSLRMNYFNRNDRIDSEERYKVLVALAEGNYDEVAKKAVDKAFTNKNEDFKNDLSASVASHLERLFPKNVNNSALINRINESAALAGITETVKLNPVLNESRETIERRRNIISLLGEKSQQRLNQVVQAAKNRRRSKFGSWMQRTHGRWDAKPWADYKNRFGDHAVTPLNMDSVLSEYGNDRALTAQVDDWVDRLYNIDYPLENGAVISSTVNTISVDSGGLRVEGTITLTTPNGDRLDIGEFERVLGANAVYSSEPFTIHNSVLEIFDYDTETLDFIDSDWKSDLIDQGIDPDTRPTTKGSGFATVFNQNAWNWLKDAGFNNVSIRAGLADGGYVWGRMGFRHATRDDVVEFWGKIDDEVLRYEQAPEAGSGLIKSDIQAAMLKQLSQQARTAGYKPSSSPAHMEVVMALETDADDPSARKAEVRDWISKNNLLLTYADLSLDDYALDAENPNVKRSAVNSTVFAAAPHAMPEQLGLISNPVMDVGDIAIPKTIINPSISNSSDAVAFVRSGGSLNEVPNEFWSDILEQTSSADPTDTKSLFYSPVVRQGIGGWVNVYISKNSDGSLSNSGWAVKHSIGRNNLSTNIQSDDTVGKNHSVVFDVVGFNLAATAGLTPHGAGYGGTQRRSVPGVRTGEDIDVFANTAILPLHLSILPEGVSAKDVRFPASVDFDPEIFEGAELRGIPERAGNLIHSWALGVADRHSGNASSFVDSSGRAYVFGFDYGMLINRDPNVEPESVLNYLKNTRVSFVDEGLLEESKNFYSKASFDDRQRLRERIDQTVERMLDGYASVVNEGFSSFLNSSLGGFESTFTKMAADKVDTDVDLDALAVNEKRNIVERLQQIFSSLEFVVESRDEVKNNLKQILLGD